MFKRVLTSILSVLLISFAYAQEVKVHGKFMADSIRLGQPISYYLAARYPQSNTILFPDSSFSFFPFEFQNKKFTTTRTENGSSYDSVVYTLISFEIDSLQKLKLPIFVVQEKDCTSIFSTADTVFFNKLVKNLPDSVQLSNVPLKTNTNYFNVPWILNYPLLSIILASFIAFLVVGWIVFGKRIKKYLRAKRLAKSFASFAEQYERAVEKAESAQTTEAALLIWKKYLENLLEKPFTKLTTKEISERESDDRMVKSLGNIDRMIYANLPSNKEHFVNLKSFSQDQFYKKLEEVKNG